jgi:polysaccharide pyruvyl transferase WcaK-like protein
MKILITNSVPLNGGDEALLRATVESLTARWPASEITVLCGEVELCRKQVPDLRLASDLEHVRSDSDWRQVLELYRRADIVLSTPGSFFHDHYAIEDRLRGLEVALDFGKPVVLFAQSVGPFWKPRSLKRVPPVFNRVSCICVREALSKQHLLDCGVEASRIRETADAAFLWRQLAPELFTPKRGPVKTVGLCFRAWPLQDAAAVQETVAKADRLCRHLLADTGRELVFLSTCQGIPGYVDDSLIALQVVGRLPPELGARCRVDRARYAPRQLIRALGRCDAFIGMRLHGCILAMLGGTPAMGLGYEPKTEGVFRQLGLEPYQVPFDTAGNSWLRCADRFLADLPEIRAGLPGKLDSLCGRAGMNLDVVGELLASRAGQPAPVGSRAGPRDDERRTDAGAPAYFGALAEEARWHRQIPVVAREIAAVTPEGCRFILVDNDQLGDKVADGRQAIPFLERGGQYWGAPPDDETAIVELERLRRSGADFVAFVWPAFWWLDHYTGLHRHLRTRFRCALENDRLVVFDLTSPR